ncbi:MAG: hypothetical protein P8J50_15095 [Acidimicrobiales bacterium]|nr:hypothetical protein [Acidimicrobiales bacterium]
MYSELTAAGHDDFVIISAAQDSQGEAAAGKLFDKANVTYHCIVDATHKISTLFGWVNVPSAAWIDEEGRIVRSNEGVYAGEHTIKMGVASMSFGGTAFADATRDWVQKGADSEFVWSAEELREHLKPVSDDTLLADPTFKLGVHFVNDGDGERAQRHFADAQRLSPDNWNYHRQGWTHKSGGHALRMWSKKTKAMRENEPEKAYYDPMGLPGEDVKQSSQVEWIWTTLWRKLRGS